MASSALAALALALAAGPAGAHGGDTGLVHGCIDNGGNVKIVGAGEACKKNEVALDWARDGGGEAPELTWGNLTGIPSDLLDGDDDGSAAVGALRTELATDDGAPNQAGDPVSFSKIKDLTTMSGDGRITGEFVRDASLTGADVENGTLTGADLAERTIPGDRIATGSIDSGHLAPGVLDRIVASTSVDLPEIQAGERAAVGVPLGGVDPLDVVVVSPPASLDSGLVFAGADVLAPGTVTLYLHNITPGAIDPAVQTWTIRRLRTGG